MEGAIAAAFVGDQIEKHRSKTGIGAHSIFLGQVRADAVDGNRVTAIQYTAYREMALQKMHDIRESIFSKFDLACLHVYHSLGEVPAGGISLFVFSSSVHRAAAFAACEEVVERIKNELPVWGKEIFENETHRWKVNK